MKKLLVVASCTVIGFSAIATQTEKQSTPDRAEQVRQFNERRYRHTGGDLVKPGKGYIAIVDRTSKYSEPLKGVVELLQKELSIEFKMMKEEPKDAAMVVRIVDEQGKPPMLVAPEKSWAEINVAALTDDLKDAVAKEKFASMRTRKMLIRAVAYASGAGGSSFSGNLFDIVSVRDLDYVEEFLPIDVKAAVLTHMKKRGVIPSQTCSYLRAVRQGWAPAPTNDIQKAIWDKVHQLPTQPIKILPETKKVKE